MGPKIMYTHFHRGYLQIFLKLNQNVMCSVYCGIVSKDGAGHMNARATLSNGRTVRQSGDGTVVQVTQNNLYHCTIGLKFVTDACSC